MDGLTDGRSSPPTPRGRVLLVFPPAFFRLASGHLPNAGMELPYTFPPLGLLYLGTILRRAGYEVELIDFAGESYQRERLVAAALRADVIGFSVVRNNRDKVTALIDDLVAAGVRRPIIVGGPDVTLRPVLFDHTVATVVGEAEISIVDIVERIMTGGDLGQARGILFRDPATGEERTGRPPELPTQLDDIPVPDRNLCDRNHYSLFGPRQRGKTAVVVTSRGCPFHCSFCSRIALTQNTYRVRSPENVLAELEVLHREGYRFLFFGDNNFLLDRKRVLAIIDGIIARGFDFRIVVAGRVDAADPELFARLRQAGVFLLSMGLESGVQGSLDFLNKGSTVERNRRAVVLAHQAGLFVHGNFIFGCAEETEADLLANRRFALELPLDSIFVNVLAYQYGSALWADAHARGLIAEDELNKTATAEHGLARLPEARLRRALKDLLLRFFFRPSYWLRLAIKSVRTGEYDFMRLVAGLCVRYLYAEIRNALRRKQALPHAGVASASEQEGERMKAQVQERPRGRILMVFPEARANYGSGDLKREDVKVDDLGAVYPPLGPLYVAAALERAGFAVRFADFSVEPYSVENLRRHLEGCQVLGLHTQTHYRDSSARIARDARQLVPDLRVLAGGPDVTLFQHLPEGVDVAMTGEVERTVADVVAAMLAGSDLNGLPGVIFHDGERIVRTEELPVEENPGATLWPARHLVSRRDYSLFGAFRGKSTSLITGRGCTGHCRFCARPAYAYFRYRPRPVDDVLDEIQSVYEQGYRFLYITDDNLLAERERAMALVKGIVLRKIRIHLKIVARVDVADPELYDALAAAGVRFVDFGIESSSQATLDFYRKRATVEQNRRAVELADERGIFTHAHVILGAPFEDRAAMRDTIRFVEALPLDTVFFNILGYRRGSLLWQEAREKGLVRDEEEVVLASRERGLGLLDRPELVRVHGEAVRQYYLRPSYLKHGLRKMLRLRDPELAWAITEVAAKAALKVGWRSARRWLARPRAASMPSVTDRADS